MTQLVELASGVDSLYLSGQCDLPGSLLDALELGRAEAQESGSPAPFSFGGYDWRLKGHALQKYRFWLDHPIVSLGITPSEKLPPLYAQSARKQSIRSVQPVWCSGSRLH